mgnify:CR=1 FL=1
MDILYWAVSALFALGLSFLISTSLLQQVFLKWNYKDFAERLWVSLTLWGLLMTCLTVVFMGIIQFLIFKV